MGNGKEIRHIYLVFSEGNANINEELFEVFTASFLKNLLLFK